PEVFSVAMDELPGYTFPVDWWSLGVTLYELLARGRPYDIHSATSLAHIKSLFNNPIHFPSRWSSNIVTLFSKLLCLAPGARLSSVSELKQVPGFKKLNFDCILEKQLKPAFTPPRDHLNCDPTFELEEMIVEAKPLHKKKKRLAKQRSLRGSSSLDTPELEIEAQLVDFVPYNREKELIKKEMEIKENEWEQELIEAMNASTNSPNAPVSPAPSAGGGLLVPPQMSRRRSSTKLNVSPLSVQVRLAATPNQRPSGAYGSSAPTTAQGLADRDPGGGHSEGCYDDVFLKAQQEEAEMLSSNPTPPIVPSIQIFDRDL
ncbi:hypothetical protein GE061_014940, partial [Apolygus lucorum]